MELKSLIFKKKILLRRFCFFLINVNIIIMSLIMSNNTLFLNLLVDSLLCKIFQNYIWLNVRYINARLYIC